MPDYTRRDRGGDAPVVQQQQPAPIVESTMGNGAMCQDLSIPTVAAPRAPLDRYGEAPGLLERALPWVSPIGGQIWDSSQDWIREVDGDSSRQLHPFDSPGIGTDYSGLSGDPNAILRDQVAAGNYPTIVPQTHRELMGTAIPQAARDSLTALGQDVHNPYDTGAGDYNIDEYSMVMDKLPDGYATPEEFMAAFLRSPNGMANDQSTNPLSDFDFWNEFHPKQAGSQQGITDPNHTPGVGDWYHIDIAGPDNGDVMLVDSQSCDQRTSATVQTMTDQNAGPGNDNHPVSGRRQFGMEQLPDGTYRFYTRGFDRQNTGVGRDVQASNAGQHQDWSSLMDAMASQHGGRAERTDEDGNPIWGWARQVPVDTMISSMQPGTQPGP